MSDLKELIAFYPRSGNSFGEMEEVSVVPELRSAELTEHLEIDSGIKLDLNKDGSSWIEMMMLPEIPGTDVFEEFWSQKPEELGRIATGPVPRYQQSYGKDYHFSGSGHSSKPTPDIVQRYLDWVNEPAYAKLYDDTGFKVSERPSFNQSFVNWYENGNHYIGPHSDDESQIRLSGKGETVIASLNFQEGPVNRIFRIKPKKKGLGKERVDIEMPNGLAIVMGGLCQSTHTHQVPKATKSRKHVGRRVNLTFRQFK